MAIAMTSAEVEDVRRLVTQREVLRAPFAKLWPRIESLNPDIVQQWASATLELFHVNAGPGCIIAFWQAAGLLAPTHIPLISEGGLQAANICRLAGAKAALACLENLPTALRLTQAQPASLRAWWHGLDRLAQAAPSLLAETVRRIEILLADGDGFAFADFVAAGLKATATNKARRAAFFALEDPLAQTLLTRRAGGGQGFAECETMLGAFIAGLWGRAPRLKAGPANITRRTMIASGTVVMPSVYAGVAREDIRRLYRAAAAHAYAHLTLPTVLHPVGPLKPMQIALIGLIEDARIEALAIRQAPGLRHLWSGFHTAQPGGVKTAVSLMARLARALLDPNNADPDGFVEKGRALFAEASAKLADPLLSRAIGGLLGNDLGQMRLQFNAKTYAVEPAYRDDNMHLWELPETPDDSLSLTVDTARSTNNDNSTNPAPGDDNPAPSAREAAPDERGDLLATYPEWDSSAGVERPAWTSLRDHMPRLRDPALTDQGEVILRAQINRLVRASVVGRTARQPRQQDGEELDLDAVIDAAVARRAGLPSDGRIYRDRRPRGRDLATLIIVDISQSTAAIDASGQSVLAAERVAVGALASALEASGDCYALRAFASAGRDDVRLTRLKDFEEPLSDQVVARLAGLSSGLSTRLGAALRHSGAELAAQRTTRKMVLVLTDGEPSDIDVTHPQELVEDARRACRSLRQSGIDVFGIVMDPEGVGSASTIFGRHNTMYVRRLPELPSKLANVYFRLAQR
jgi:hypothetical protein